MGPFEPIRSSRSESLVVNTSFAWLRPAEPNPATGSLTSGSYPTYYTYDALGNLKYVNQVGDGSAPRTRSFTYDSLSRLLTAQNPESSTVQYGYDADGNLTSKTDAWGITINYSPAESPIDALNRVTKKTYSNGDPSVGYLYDQSSYNGLTITNGIGRRTGMSDGTGQTAWSYDSAGRVLNKRQTISGVTNGISYTYNAYGLVLTLTSPAGHVYTYGYNNAARPVSLADNGSGTTYVQNAHYAAPGMLTSAQHGLNLAITEANTFNNRLQPTLLSAGSPSLTVFSLSYNWILPGNKNNGTVYQIQNNRDNTRSVQYGYDWLNRLTSAHTYASTNWGDDYVYDSWGNLLQENVTQGTAENLQVTVDSGNHINTGGWTYDAAGNMTWEAGLGNALKYDAENHLNPVTGYVYSYDGDGHRVEKNNGGSITYYWYDGSNVISTTGTLVRDYVYFNGRRLAYFAPSSGSQHYYWSDHVRSASVMSNSSGDTIEWEADYYPFGTPNVLNNYLENYFRFSDYQWDPEMGYYYASAREDAPRLGRMMSPDPLGGSLANPQSLNRYACALNNPVRFTDPTGMCVTNCANGDKVCQRNAAAFEKARQHDLKSKNAAIRNAANAYGDPGKANGITVGFGDPGKGRGGTTTVTRLEADPDHPGSFRADATVTIRPGQSGADLEATVGHEGEHVEDAQGFASTVTAKGFYDLSKNLTSFQTELNAYRITNSILSDAGVKGGFGTCGDGPCVLGFGVTNPDPTIRQFLADPANGYGVTEGNPGSRQFPEITTPNPVPR